MANTTKANLRARNAKVIAGIQKDLASMATITLAGVPYTPSSLAAVFTADTQAMDDADAAHAVATQKVQDEQTTHARTTVVLHALSGFLGSYYGKQAVGIYADFGMNAPTTGTRTVATKAVAVAKSKATRAARGTKGKVAKLAITGTVDAAAITAAINAPAATPAPAPAASPATPAAAPAAAPAATKPA